MVSFRSIAGWPLAIFFSLSLAANAQNLPELVVRYADIVLYNGKVHTVDRDSTDYTVAEAVAVRDGKFLAVGKNTDILPLAGPQTVRIDLQGRAVTPGFIDTHSHQMEYARVPEPQAEQYGRLRLSLRDPKEKGQALQAIEALANKLPEGQWMEVSVWNDVVRSLTLEELDRVAPRHPVYASGTPSYGALNSRGLEELLRLYPNIEGIQRDAQGGPTGQVETPVMGVVDMELIPPIPLDIRVAAYKREMDRWVGGGITTFSSRATGNELSAYVQLARQDRMNMRFGYSHQWLMDNPNWRSYVRRLGDFVGLGSDMLWNVGATIVSVDGTLGDNCVTIEKRKPAGSSGPLGDCRALPGMPRYEAMKYALTNGIRVAGVHAAGDRGVDAILSMILELKDQGVPVENLRPNLDHCTMISAENIRKAQQIPGMTFSCAPKYVFEGTAKDASEIWDREIAHSRVVPTKALLDAGIRVVWEVDTGSTVDRRPTGYPVFHPMLQMQVFTTRMDNEGNIWGPRHGIDRRTALLMMTRWGAHYLLREDRLGSIEPGKLADLAVLDGDLLSAPDNRLIDLAVVLTLVGGQVVYADPSFSQKVGAGLARVQHPHAAIYAAYRPSEEMRKWADGFRPSSQ
ncbi:MAG: amidohydrolase family protein [Acidobacteria bacterium]|nr:amidohydrolase family protein [Acidobacteriota bacterium]